MLLSMSNKNTELALTLVYAVFNLMCSRGFEIKKGNPKIMINSIQDQKITKLGAYKKGTAETTQPAGGSTQRIHFKAPDKEVTPWQWVTYQIEDINL